jgi:hypothetical protein
MNIEKAAVEVNENLLAHAPDAFNLRPRQRSGCRRERTARHAMRKNLRMPNRMTHYARRNRPHHRFNFRKFRHSVLRKFGEDAAFFDLHGIALQLDVGIEVVDACFTIEGPTVPRAHDLIAIQIALSQRTAGVRAQTVKDAKRAVGMMAKCVGSAVDFHLRQGAGREFAKRLDFNERHLPTGYL